MSSLITAIAFALLLLAADPTPPASEVTPPTPAVASDSARDSASARPDEGRLVCRRETRPNTRFTGKVCKTVAEWEERSRAAQESFEDVRGRTITVICPPVGGCD